MGFEFSNTNWLHLGNILFLLAYLVRDILWLRILTVVATMSLMCYYFCCTLTEPVYWNTVFILINLVQIALLIKERRPVKLGEEEGRLYRTVFNALSPRDFLKLLTIADRKKATTGDKLMQQGGRVDELMLLSKGKSHVEIDGRFITEISSNQFIGEMGFLTDQAASASVIASVPVEYLAWPADTLRDFFKDNPQIHIKVQGILGTDLVEKLRKEAFSAAHPSKIMDMYQKGELE